jgi:hypothetical protein
MKQIKIQGLSTNLRSSSNIPRKNKIKNLTIRQQIGLEETIIKEIEQNQLTWHGQVQKMAEGILPKIALKWMPKQRKARRRPKKNWMEGVKKAMNGRNLKEGQGEDREQWSIGDGQEDKEQWNLGVGKEDREQWSPGAGQEDREQWSLGVGQEDREQWSLGVGQEDREQWSLGVGQEDREQ